MRLVFCLIATFFSLSSHAASNVRYEIIGNSKQVSLLALAEFQDYFSRQSFWSVDRSNTGRFAALGADQVFVSSNLQQVIYLKLGLVPKPFSEWIDVAGGTAFHGKSADNSPFALFFEGISKKEAASLVAGLRMKRQSAKADLLSLLLPRAHAASATCFTATSLAAVTAAAASTTAITGFQTLTTCALSALDGAKETAIGPLESLKRFAEDPSAFWENTKKSFRQLADFVTHIQTEMAELNEALRKGVDPEIIAQIGCTIVGEVVTSVGITAITGGAAAAATAKALTSASLMIARVAKMKNALVALSRAKQAKGSLSVSNALKGMVSCEVR
jgi:hypothetical protein